MGEGGGGRKFCVSSFKHYDIVKNEEINELKGTDRLSKVVKLSIGFI